MFRTLLIVAAFLSLTGVSLAAEIELPREVTLPEKFTLRLPANWVQIPKKTVDNFSLKSGKVATATTFTSHGFQAEAKKWLTCPWVLVQVNRKGKLGPGDIKKTWFGNADINKGAEKLRDVINGVEKGRNIYDDSDHTVWTVTAMPAATGTIYWLTVTKLTNEGYIRFNFLSYEKDYKKHVKTFEAIVRKMSVDPSIKYKP